MALLNETEAVLSYLEREVKSLNAILYLIDWMSNYCLTIAFALSLSQDTFFYSLVYDPTQKTLLADKGEIRVGPRFQADVPEMLQEG